MKQVLSCFLVIALLLGASCAGSKNATYKSQTAPGYVKKAYQKIIVFAKLEEDVYRKKLEEAMVKELEKKGFTAIVAYSNLDVSYAYDSVAFMKRVTELNADGFVALRYLGQLSSVQDRYTYTGGYYNLYGGGAVPWDLDTKSVKTGYVQVDFFNLDSRSTRWNTVVPAVVSDGIDIAVNKVSIEAVFRLKADGIL